MTSSTTEIYRSSNIGPRFRLIEGEGVKKRNPVLPLRVFSTKLGPGSSCGVAVFKYYFLQG